MTTQPADETENDNAARARRAGDLHASSSPKRNCRRARVSSRAARAADAAATTATSAAGAQPPATGAVPTRTGRSADRAACRRSGCAASSPPPPDPRQPGAPAAATPTATPGARRRRVPPRLQRPRAPRRGPTVPVRVYVVRGVTKKGRPGPPSTRVTIPLVPAPPTPGTPSASFTERAVSVTWLAPVPAGPAESGDGVQRLCCAAAGEDRSPQSRRRASLGRQAR